MLSGGVCDGRAWGAAAAGAGGRLGGRVRLDKHFFAWTVAALPPLLEAPDGNGSGPGTKAALFVPGTPYFRFPGTPVPHFVPGSILPGAK